MLMKISSKISLIFDVSLKLIKINLNDIHNKVRCVHWDSKCVNLKACEGWIFISSNTKYSKQYHVAATLLKHYWLFLDTLCGTSWKHCGNWILSTPRKCQHCGTAYQWPFEDHATLLQCPGHLLRTCLLFHCPCCYLFYLLKTFSWLLYEYSHLFKVFQTPD